MKKQSLYTERVENGNRNFYFDIRDTEKGSNYLVMSELKKNKDEDTERRQILIFESEIDAFGAAFMRTLLHFSSKNTNAKPRAARIEEARTTYSRAYEPWSKKEDAELALLYSQGKIMEDIAKEFQRQPGAIKLRVDKLGLVKAVAA